MALLLALDSGTSMVKAVAFTDAGEVVAAASRPNRVDAPGPARAEQCMDRTWQDAAAVLAEVADRVAGWEIAGLAVTGQGDGTWLVDGDGRPVGPALLWLDARAAGLVEHLHETGAARSAFVHTGTGLNACQQSAQLLWLREHEPERLRRVAHAMHCKDWLYLNLTGTAAADPSEACFTWGDYRTRTYRDEVLQALGAAGLARLLPPWWMVLRRATPCGPRPRRAPACPSGCRWCWPTWTWCARGWAPGCMARGRRRPG